MLYPPFKALLSAVPVYPPSKAMRACHVIVTAFLLVKFGGTTITPVVNHPYFQEILSRSQHSVKVDVDASNERGVVK